MTDATPPRYDRVSAVGFLGYAAGVALIVWCLNGAGFSLEKVTTSPPRFADFMSRAWPPNLEPSVLERLGWKMIETLRSRLPGP